MPRVIVVGAGISGLSAAAFLDEEGVELTVVEAGPRAGGNVRSDREDGRVLDLASNGWLDNEPAVGRLLDRVGLAGRTVPANRAHYGTRWIFADGRMHPVPMSPPAMIRTRLLGWGAKLRLLLEPFMPRGPADRDESVGDFVRRRLGQAFLDRMVGPMVAGIFAADADRLSLRAGLPRMYELEREYRSLFVAMMKLRRGGAPSGHLTTLEGGVGTLTDTLAARLGDRLRLATPVTAIERRKGGWLVHAEGGSLEADAVVLAAPAWAQAPIVRGLDPEAAAALDGIPYAPTNVLITAHPAGAWDRSPDGFGVLVARNEDTGGVLGTVFTSNMFPEQAREGEVLLRTIVGGGIHPEAAALDDQEILARARRFHAACFGAEREGPHWWRVYRHPRGIPQYPVGHPSTVRAVRAAQARHPGLFFTGNHLEGVGVKDCVRNGERIAREALAFLGHPAGEA